MRHVSVVRDCLPVVRLLFHFQPFYLYVICLEGPQQCDQRSPLLFCSTIHSLMTLLESDLTQWYIHVDDRTLAGHRELVASDIRRMVRTVTRYSGFSPEHQQV